MDHFSLFLGAVLSVFVLCMLLGALTTLTLVAGMVALVGLAIRGGVRVRGDHQRRRRGRPAGSQRREPAPEDRLRYVSGEYAAFIQH